MDDKVELKKLMQPFADELAGEARKLADAAGIEFGKRMGKSMGDMLYGLTMDLAKESFMKGVDFERERQKKHGS